MYLPLHSDSEKHVLFRIGFRKVATITVGLPLVAFSLCVALSVLKDFESSTFTHCQVFNLLPSVSAAIGSFYPQNQIWMFAIGLHAPVRYFIATLYFTYYRMILNERAHFIAVVACLLHVLEITSLVGLSFWNSSDYYPIHKTCFITFVGASEIYMLLSCILIRKQRRGSSTDLERISLKWKWNMLIANILGFMFAGYFFMRHNTYCESMVYTLFAVSEYVVIFTNMGFHMTACYDFAGKVITFYDPSMLSDIAKGDNLRQLYSKTVSDITYMKRKTYL